MRLSVVKKIVYWCVIIVSLYLIYVYLTPRTEGFTDEPAEKIAFCLITNRPNEVWLEFLTTFSPQYDVYVAVDDNTMNIEPYREKYPSINFIMYREAECKEKGYWDASYLIKKEVISWDKALYHFASVNTSYKHVWFCEDDVFIHNAAILQGVDAQYPLSDMICKNKITNTSGEVVSWMHWVKAQENFELPWSGSLISLCRLSRGLLQKVDEFVVKNGKLNFLEILFSNIADKNGMTIETPYTLGGIEHYPKEVGTVVDITIIHHAIKSMDDHVLLRKK
jgi:hypothetical protein